MNARNVSHAKEIVNSIGESRFRDVYLPRVIRRFGHEFFEYENLLPYIFGGWETPSLYGVDLSILHI